MLPAASRNSLMLEGVGPTVVEIRFEYDLAIVGNDDSHGSIVLEKVGYHPHRVYHTISQWSSRSRIRRVRYLRDEVAAWQASENATGCRRAKVNWQFTTDDARVKLKRLYPTFGM